VALAAGVHPKIASERLGHATIAVTLDLYSHVTSAIDAEAAAMVASKDLRPPQPSQRAAVSRRARAG
jgi:integrase